MKGCPETCRSMCTPPRCDYVLSLVLQGGVPFLERRRSVLILAFLVCVIGMLLFLVLLSRLGSSPQPSPTRAAPGAFTLYTELRKVHTALEGLRMPPSQRRCVVWVLSRVRIGECPFRGFGCPPWTPSTSGLQRATPPRWNRV